MEDTLPKMPHINNQVQFLCFLLDDNPKSQIYAINVFKIREIIYQEGDFAQAIGNENSVILGSLTVRGEAIPLIDVKRWLHFNKDIRKNLEPFSIDTQKNLIVICNFSDQTIGLKIGSVKHIIQRSWEEVQAGSEHGLKEHQKIIATTRYSDDSIIQILDIEQMLIDAFPMLGYNNTTKIKELKRIDSHKHILVAEDSFSVEKTLKHIIKSLGLKCIGFPNGGALLKHLSSYSDEELSNIGAIITDIEMPHISGFEVLKKVHNDPRLKNIPVIVNSSMENDANYESAMKLGASGFMKKSEPEEVAFYLNQILKKDKEC